MKYFYIKALNTCVMRRQDIARYRRFLQTLDCYEVGDPQSADLIIVWTCSFRNDVKEMSLAVVNNLAVNYAGKKVVVTGCMPDIFPELVTEWAGYANIIVAPWKNDEKIIAGLFGSAGVEKLPAAASAAGDVYIERRVTNDVTNYAKAHPDSNVMFCDQFAKVVISEGCNACCSYCSERLAFPPYRSRTIREISDACRRAMEETGVYDLALMGDSIGDFGCDTGETFDALLSSLCAQDARARIVLNNFHPKFFLAHFDFLISLVRDKRIRHVNLPIQSASSKVLTLMNREYGKQELDRIFDALNVCGFKTFDTHIIAGFPGETEADFQETVNFLLEKKPAYVLASAYMESPKCAAADLPGKVDVSVKHQRLQYAAESLSKAGIIVNMDGGNLAKERIKRVLTAGTL